MFTSTRKLGAAAQLVTNLYMPLERHAHLIPRPLIFMCALTLQRHTGLRLMRIASMKCIFCT